MRRHLNALKAHLEARGWRAHLIDVADDTALPYVLISPVYAGQYDPSLSGVTDDFDGYVRLTAVAESVNAALGLADAMRAYLSPGDAWTTIIIPGFHAEICWQSFDVADVDRDITGTALNNHRAFSKHTYHLNSRSLT